MRPRPHLSVVVISFDHIGIQQFNPASLVPGRSKPCEFLKGSCECVPVIESAFQRQPFQVELTDKAFLDKLFAIPDPVLVEEIIEIKADLPVEKC